MRIQGDLATYEFSDLLQWLAQGCKTGVLTVSDGDGDVEYQLGFDRGRIDMSSSSDPEKRLDSYLFRKGVIDKATLDRAERLREATQMMSGQVLVTLGAVSEMQLGQTLRDRTEEILCELLTWDRGTFEFSGGERPESSMVPISLEVTKLLLESMHRLDQGRQGEGTESIAGEAEMAPKPCAPSVSPDATQAIEGLALAEILDPGSPPPAATSAGIDPAEDLPSADLLPPYAVMARAPGSVRRLAPYVLVVTLSFLVGGFHLANIEASAQAVNVGPGSEPIVFTRTSGPPPRTAVVQAAADAVTVAPTRVMDASDAEEALRQRYEQELASLRQELQEARRLALPAGERSAGPAGSEPDRGEAAAALPADSILRAAVSRPAPTAAAAALPPSSPEAPPPAAAALRAVELPAGESPLTPAAASPTQPERLAAPAAAAAVELVNPALVDRPTPRYPAAAQRHGLGATVMLRVLIGTDGRVEEVSRMGAKAGMGFDRAAEEAALESIWAPGTRNGEPAAMWAAVRFDFKP